MIILLTGPWFREPPILSGLAKRSPILSENRLTHVTHLGIKKDPCPSPLDTHIRVNLVWSRPPPPPPRGVGGNFLLEGNFTSCQTSTPAFQGCPSLRVSRPLASKLILSHDRSIYTKVIPSVLQIMLIIISCNKYHVFLKLE